MAYTVQRKGKNGKIYTYQQESYRVGKKVKTRHIPKNKLRNASPGMALAGLVVFAVKAATGTLGPPGGRPHGERYNPTPRHEVNRDEWASRRSTMTETEWAHFVFTAKAGLAEKEDREEAMQVARQANAFATKEAAPAAVPASDPSEAPTPDDAPDTAPAGEGEG